MIDLSAGPCTYGKIETEEGSISTKSLPRLRNVAFHNVAGTVSEHYAHDIFVGQLASLIATTIEHVVAPDVRYSPILLNFYLFPFPDHFSFFYLKLTIT